MNVSDWGIIEELNVRADTLAALTMAIGIVMTEHSSIVGWQERDGGLILFWGGDKVPNKFLTPLKTHEEVANALWGWLKLQKYPDCDDEGDGSNHKGFRLTLNCDSYLNGAYSAFNVKPTWICYSK